MRTAAIVIAAAIAALQMFAEVTPPDTQRKLTPEQAKAMRERREKVRRQYELKTGGVVKMRAAGPVLAFVNAQGKVPAAALTETKDAIERTLMLPVDVIEGKAENPVADVGGFINFKTAACILLVESGSLPPMLVAPEAKWAIVNVTALAKGAEGDVLQKRVKKELWRAFFHLLGAANSMTIGCLMQTITDPAELDKILADRACPESYGKVINGAYRLGVCRMKVSNYRKACEEGWAPPPANDNQKRIAEEVAAAKKAATGK